MSLKFVIFICLFVKCARGAGVNIGASASHSNDDVKLPVRDVIYVFDGNGVFTADPKTNKMTRIIDKSTKILGTNETVCPPNPRKKGSFYCFFNAAQYVPDKYIFATDHHGKQIVVFDIAKQSPVKAIKTNFRPEKLEYFAETDEVWVFGRPPSRTIKIIGMHNSASGGISKMKDVKSLVLKKTINIQVVKKPKCCFYFFGPCHSKDQKQDFGVAYYSWESGIHVFSIVKRAYVGYVNLTSYGCQSIYKLAYSPVKKFAFVKCNSLPRPVIVDVAKQRVVHWKDGMIPNEIGYPERGYPVSSPDGRYILLLHSDEKKTFNITPYYLESASKPMIRLADVPTGRRFTVDEVYFLKSKNGYTVYLLPQPIISMILISLQHGTVKFSRFKEVNPSIESYVYPSFPACTIDDRYVVVGENKTAVFVIDADKNNAISFIRGFKNVGYMLWVGSTDKLTSSTIFHGPKFILIFTTLLLVFFVAGEMFAE